MSTEGRVKNVIDYCKKEGLIATDILISDWGMTIKLVVKRGEKEFVLPITELFYDTNEQGELTKIHGLIDRFK